jgi:hypothetical protein
MIRKYNEFLNESVAPVPYPLMELKDVANVKIKPVLYEIDLGEDVKNVTMLFSEVDMEFLIMVKSRLGSASGVISDGYSKVSDSEYSWRENDAQVAYNVAMVVEIFSAFDTGESLLDIFIGIVKDRNNLSKTFNDLLPEIRLKVIEYETDVEEDLSKTPHGAKFLKAIGFTPNELAARKFGI